MAAKEPELISMADIARLAGESRATVGNWKSRNPDDFPPERGRGPRGPLYDRAEVTHWLDTKGRLDSRPRQVVAMWDLINRVRGSLDVDEAVALILLLLAIRASEGDAWDRLHTSAPGHLESTLRQVSHLLLSSAEELSPRSPLPERDLHEVVSMLSSIDALSAPEIADALLEQAARAMGHRGGEYLSPPSVRSLIIGLAAPEGVVYNPGSGVGQLLVDAARASTSPENKYVGQELNRRVWAMAQANLLLHGIDARIELGDVFTDDRFPDLRADRVVAVPPWNQRLHDLHFLDDARWTWGEPGERDGNAAWIQHCLYHLAEHGRAVLALPNGVLFEGGRAGRIRQRIIRAGLLDAVISLPPGLFDWTSIACSLLVFVKGRPTVQGKPAPILMVDLGEESTTTLRRAAQLRPSLVEEVVALYHRWTIGEQPSAEYAAIATFDAVVENDYVVDPGRYMSTRIEPVDFAELTTKRAALIDELEHLTETSRRADDHLKSLLENDR